MRRWEQEEERIRQAVLGAATAEATRLGVTDEELRQALMCFEGHQVIAFPNGSGRGIEAMQTAAKAFVTVWPPYIDAEKTLPEGRRIPKELAFPGPNVHDIAEAVSSLGLPCLLEAVKRYPRDPFAVGRVRVELTNPNSGKPWNADVTTRRQLLLKIAEAIPSLKTRLVRNEAQRALDLAQQEKGSAAAAASSSSLAGGGEEGGAGALEGSGGGGGGGKVNPKKKGKKKGRK